nr:fasciclin-like arabinogalactan protein 11 [Ipomoea batatas]
MKHHFLVLLFLVIAVLQCCSIRLVEAQAAGPAPSGPTNITKILEKAGQFTTFMRLLKITQVSDQINNQLNNSNQGLTVFAPTDNAFSGLKAGTLNSLTDQEKVELVQFHVLSSFFSMSQFQTASNPLKTQAGDSAGSFPLNVTTAGNQVNVSTGVVDSTVANTVYTDGQLAVYQVDKSRLRRRRFADEQCRRGWGCGRAWRGGGGGCWGCFDCFHVVTLGFQGIIQGLIPMENIARAASQFHSDNNYVAVYEHKPGKENIHIANSCAQISLDSSKRKQKSQNGDQNLHNLTRTGADGTTMSEDFLPENMIAANGNQLQADIFSVIQYQMP